MLLYKYLSRQGLVSTLQNKTVQFSRPWVFNDPYDNRIPFDIDRSETVERELIKNINISINNFIESKKDNKEFKANNFFDNCLIKYAANSKHNLTTLINNPEQVKHQILNNIANSDFKEMHEMERAGAKDFISCFSQVKDSFLMWSHYAESYTGGVLAFEFDKDFAHEYRNIRYSDEVLKLNNNAIFSKIDPYSEFKRLLHENYTVKAKCWEYEREIRLTIFNTKLINNETRPNIKQANNKIYVPYHTSELKAVYLGVRTLDRTYCDTDYIKEIMELLDDLRLEQVSIFKSALSDISFAINFNSFNA